MREANELVFFWLPYTLHSDKKKIRRQEMMYIIVRFRKLNCFACCCFYGEEVLLL